MLRHLEVLKKLRLLLAVLFRSGLLEVEQEINERGV
jgi:hypothetical protein